MTNLALVAYPILGEPDHQWIESVRAQHDPQAGLIRAHFTLVFPVDLDPGPAVAHWSAVCARFRPIRFSTKGAKAIRDRSRPGGHVFIVPGRGCREIAALHDELNDGIFRGESRERALFLPHITIAACADFDRCVQLARELDPMCRAVGDRLDGLEAVLVSPDRVEPLAQFMLG